MVGHSGQLEPAIKAVEALDSCLMRLTEAVNDSNNQMLVTADHGKIEQMVDPISGGEHKANTNNPVPLVYLGPQDIGLRDGGGRRAGAGVALGFSDSSDVRFVRLFSRLG